MYLRKENTLSEEVECGQDNRKGVTEREILHGKEHKGGLECGRR